MGIEQDLKAEYDALSARYGVAIKIYAAVIVLLFMLLLGSSAVGYHYHQKATEFQLVAQAKTKEAADAVARAKQADVAKVSADSETQHAHRETVKWRTAYDALPRPVPVLNPPAATEIAQIEKDLTEFGLKPGVRVFELEPTGPQSSVLLGIDAVVAWSWHASSLAVPVLEKKLEAADGLIDAQTKETGALQVNLAASEKARDEWFTAHGAEHQRAEALQSEVGVMTKEAKAKQFAWYLKAGAALVGGYFAGRSLR